MFDGGAIKQTKKGAHVINPPSKQIPTMDETLRQSSKALRKYVKTSIPNTLKISTRNRRRSVKGGGYASSVHVRTYDREDSADTAGHGQLPQIAKQIMADIRNKISDINKTEYAIQNLLDDPIKLASIVNIQSTMADAYKTLQNTSETLVSLREMLRTMYRHRLFHRTSKTPREVDIPTDEHKPETSVAKITDESDTEPHQHSEPIDTVMIIAASDSISVTEPTIATPPAKLPIKLGGTIHVTEIDDTDSVSVVLGGVLNMTNIYGGAG